MYEQTGIENGIENEDQHKRLDIKWEPQKVEGVI